MGEGGSEGHGGAARRSSGDADLKARLSKLGERIETLKGEDGRRTAAAGRTERDAQGMARGFRLSTEFVAAVLVGGGIGWVFDRVLGVAPLGLIVFLMLGFAAGVVNVMRAAGISNGPPDGTGTT